MANYQIYTTHNAGETEALGEHIGIQLRHNFSGKVRHYLLTGDLGSGKTVFAKGFSKGIGLNNRILSPTFIVVRSYQLQNLNMVYYHIDLYRVPSEDNQKNLGLDDILSNFNSVTLIEWSEYLKNRPKSYMDIKIRILSDTDRSIEISEHL